MGYLPTTKYGDCSQCPARNVPCVKVGKDLFCTRCHKNNKSREYISRSTERDKQRNRQVKENSQVRGLLNSEQNKLVANQAAKDIDALQKWFDVIAKEIADHPNCWECHSWVKKEYYRAATAHILPKAIFQSVATHPLNYLILPAHCCHNKTHRLDTFSQMKIFPEAVNRFRQFQHLITEKHKLLDEFIRYANEICPIHEQSN